MYTVSRQHQWPSGDRLVDPDESGRRRLRLHQPRRPRPTPGQALVSKFARLAEGETPTCRGRGVARTTKQPRRVGAVK
jgi:hypothetical protein